MSWSQLPLKRKLLFAMAGALFISITLSTILTTVLVRSNTVERISEAEIPATLSAVSAQVAREIETRLAVASTMAVNVPVNNWLRDGEDESQRAQVVRYLNDVLQQESALTTFLVSGESRNYYTRDGLVRQLDPAKDGWFYDFVNSGKPYSLDLDIDDTNQVPTLFINYRIPGQQAITGIGLKISELSDFIRDYQVGESGLVYLVDPTGAIKIHPEEGVSGTQSLAQRPELASRLPELLNQNSVQVTRLYEPSERLIAAQYIDSLGWYVVAELPTRELFSALHEMTLLTIVLNLVLVGGFVLIAMWQSSSITRPITNASTMLQAIADGDADLTRRLKIYSKDEVGILSGAFNQFSENMRSLIAQLAGTADQVHNAAGQVQQSAKDSHRNSDEQVESIALVATAITEMGATVKEIAANAEQTANASNIAVKESDSGQRLMQHTTEEMGSLNSELQDVASAVERLADDVGQISSVLGVISGISEQTNLLALNAAIEAARAGEQGRGFAVVADEVRNLAQKSHQATEEIGSMIEKLQGTSAIAVSAMQKGGERCDTVVSQSSRVSEALDTIRNSIGTMTEMATQVATATVEQSNVVTDLEKHVTRINVLAEQTLEASEVTTHVAEQQLDSASADLKNIVSNFRY
ncbi:MAG: methyl-accepting chemotaxis protein [Saccharospirillaceae bacterium]|jgi:methyl-accepting chemotaxis protein|nr:methyl-accepting chemotaxis protein [Saccharospirillaceae bacterium]